MYPLKVKDAYYMEPPRYGDSRGYFQELHNIQTYPNRDYKQISISKSQKDVLRGLHCSFYGKFVTCIEGAIWDVFVDLRPDSPTFKQWTAQILSEENGVQMYIPPRCGHGFLSLKDGSKILYMQENCYTPNRDLEIHPFDKDIGVQWPKAANEYIISAKDKVAQSLKDALPRIMREIGPEKAGSTVDFVVMGATGFLGGAVVNVLKEQKLSYAVIPQDVRLMDRKQIEGYLDRWQPKYFINAAGTAGRPNISWCETNKEETIDINVTGQLNVAEICRQRGIHCTLFGTGCLYYYDKDHPVGSGKAYTEQDKPNFTGNFYGRMRIMLEELVQQYENVLSLRIAFPIDAHNNPRALQAKLIKYPKITSTPTSFTVMDSLFPLIPEMAKRGLTGIYNFTNPGVTTNSKILQIYKETVDPNHTWIDVEQSVSNVPRAYSELDTAKLRKHFPDIPHVDEAIKVGFRKLKKRLDMERESASIREESNVKQNAL